MGTTICGHRYAFDLPAMLCLCSCTVEGGVVWTRGHEEGFEYLPTCLEGRTQRI